MQVLDSQGQKNLRYLDWKALPTCKSTYSLAFPFFKIDLNSNATRQAQKLCEAVKLTQQVILSHLAGLKSTFLTSDSDRALGHNYHLQRTSACLSGIPISWQTSDFEM